MEAHEVSVERWSFKLAPQLTGKAQQAYAALQPDEAKTYETVRAAILRRYNINEETYRQRFRKLRPKEGESPQELVTRLKDLATRWTKGKESREALLDLIVKEQFLAILPEDVRVSVIERKPKDSEEASQFAENYLQARSTSIAHHKTSPPTTKCPRCGKYGHWSRDCPLRTRNPERQDGGQRPPTTSDSSPRRPNPTPRDFRPQDPSSQGVKCYSCNGKGHYASSCPKRSLYCDQPLAEGAELDNAVRRGTVNGVYCRDILVDTGATQTLVHKRLVADDDVLDDEVTIRCAHGDSVSYPLAVVKINIAGKDNRYNGRRLKYLARISAPWMGRP